MGVLIGIVGKPSSGKTTFLNALCKTSAKTADYPFTTINPNQGVGYVTSPCICKEFKVTCNPRNSECVNQVRKIPIKIIDVAGLVPGAHEGKGMGNQFLSDLTQADILIHVLDISGSLNEEGEQVKAGSHDPEKDIAFLENEIAQWINGIIKKDWLKAVRKVKTEKKNILDFIAEKLTGLKIKKSTIHKAISVQELNASKVGEWNEEEPADIDSKNTFYHRELYDVQTTLSTVIERTFDTEGFFLFDAVKHSIEPIIKQVNIILLILMMYLKFI